MTSWLVVSSINWWGIGEFTSFYGCRLHVHTDKLHGDGSPNRFRISKGHLEYLVKSGWRVSFLENKPIGIKRNTEKIIPKTYPTCRCSCETEPVTLGEGKWWGRVHSIGGIGGAVLCLSSVYPSVAFLPSDRPSERCDILWQLRFQWPREDYSSESTRNSLSSRQC